MCPSIPSEPPEAPVLATIYYLRQVMAGPYDVDEPVCSDSLRSPNFFLHFFLGRALSETFILAALPVVFSRKLHEVSLYRYLSLQALRCFLVGFTSIR